MQDCMDKTDNARRDAALAISRDGNWRAEYPEEIAPEAYDDFAFDLGGAEFLILTDVEADERVRANIAESLWAFNVDFIAKHANATFSVDARIAIQKMQGELCESANPIIAAILGIDPEDADCESLRDFAEAAISADGRGHFLAGYDGEESEVEAGGITFYVYRTN